MSAFRFEHMSLEDLKSMLVAVILSNPPDRDKPWIKAISEEIAKREKAAIREGTMPS